MYIPRDYLAYEQLQSEGWQNVTDDDVVRQFTASTGYAMPRKRTFSSAFEVFQYVLGDPFVQCMLDSIQIRRILGRVLDPTNADGGWEQCPLQRSWHGIAPGQEGVAAWEKNIGTEGIGKKKFHSSFLLVIDADEQQPAEEDEQCSSRAVGQHFDFGVAFCTG